MDCSPPGSSVHEIFQARILEWVAISFSRGSSQPRDRNQVSCIAGRFFTDWATREALRLWLISRSASSRGSWVPVLEVSRNTWSGVYSEKKVKGSVAHLCPTLCDPMDCSSLGSSVHGNLHTKILESTAIPFSRVSFPPRIEPGSPALQVGSLPSTVLAWRMKDVWLIFFSIARSILPSKY